MGDHNAVTVPLRARSGPELYFWKCSCGNSSGRGWPKQEAERQKRLHVAHEKRVRQR